MKSLHAIWSLLPGSVRGRMVSAFMLMAAFPILGAILVVCDYNQAKVYGTPAIVSVIVFCTTLACVGFWDIRSLLLSMMDIRTFAGDMVALRAQAREHGINSMEVTKLQRLIVYMQDQIESARRLIQLQTGTVRPVSSPEAVTFPPVLTGPALVRKVVCELASAEKAQILIGVIGCRMANDAEPCVHDPGDPPPWLRELLAHTSNAFSFIGAIQPGHWIGFLDHDHSPVALEMALCMHEKADMISSGRIAVKVWRHPRERFSVISELAHNNN